MIQLLKLAYLTGYCRAKWDKLPLEIPEEDQMECMVHMDDGFRQMLDKMEEIHQYLSGENN